MREWRRGDGRGREDWRREIPNGGRYGTDHRDVFQREREESVRGVEVVSDARAGRGKREIYWEEMETAQDAGVGGVGGPEWAVFWRRRPIERFGFGTSREGTRRTRSKVIRLW